MDSSAVVFGHNVGWGFRWGEGGQGDLEEENDPQPMPAQSPPPVLEPKHQFLHVPKGSILGSLNQGACHPIASSSSQSRESMAEALTGSSLSTSTTNPSPHESIVNSAHGLNALESDLVCDNTRPRGQIVQGENRLPTLRREKRRLEKQRS
jgi:hypothetical protein